MSVEVEAMKRRLVIMLAVDGVFLLLAVAAALGAFMYRVEWLQWAFAAAVAAGFGAQIWFIAGFRRASKEG